MSSAAPAPLPTPDRIVEGDGTVHVGWFERPFEVANLQDAPARHALASLRGTPLAALERGYRRARLKQWHYTSVVTDKLLFACAVVDAGYIGNAFAYVVDRETRHKIDYSTLTPAARGVRIAHNSVDGVTSIEQAGFGRIVLSQSSRAGTRRIAVSLDGKLGARSKPPLRAVIDLRDPGDDPTPIVVVEETEPGCWLYTHKVYGLEASGRVECGDISSTFEMGEGLAGIDFNRGYRPRETYWNWAAGCGRAVSGEPVGFNLTAHRPWPGSGASPRHHRGASDEDALDCAIWIGSRCEKLRRVDFDYDPTDVQTSRPSKEWRIRDDAGLVDLRFRPDGKRAEDVNLGLVVSRFHQPYGTFHGTLRDRAGSRVAVDGLYGVTEQHFARW